MYYCCLLYTYPDSVFSKLSPEQQQEMTASVKAMLQTLIDADLKSTGEVSQGTKEAAQAQGFTIAGDGTLEQAEAMPQPQAWNGIDGLLNGKPFMPEASPADRAAALMEAAASCARMDGFFCFCVVFRVCLGFLASALAASATSKREICSPAFALTSSSSIDGALFIMPSIML